MISCDCPGGVTLSGGAVLSADTPLLDKTAAMEIWQTRQPCLECTVTQTVACAAYPFLYERVIFSFRPCLPRPSGVYGAEQRDGGHEPGYAEKTGCGGEGGTCWDGPVWFVGFGHEKVNTRNLTEHPDEPESDRAIKHCLGVVWDGQPINLANLCESCGLALGTLAVWEANGTRLQSSLLDPGAEPPDLDPTVFRVRMLQASDPDILWDRIFIVVNNHTTKTLFDDWHARFSVEKAWLAELPAAYSALGPNNSDPEPEGIWSAPKPPPKYYHHTASFDMRSKPIHGHGHQACYDEHGLIIRTGVCAGSADWGPAATLKHMQNDVKPFIRALNLDGNPCKGADWFYSELDHAIIYSGENVDSYFRCRPTIPNNKALLSP
jgi:hypothetical protein